MPTSLETAASTPWATTGELTRLSDQWASRRQTQTRRAGSRGGRATFGSRRRPRFTGRETRRLPFANPPGSPMNHLAVFVGSRVVWAPAVVQPSANAVEMTTDETQENMLATCAAIAAAARR